jgi:Peptidyl-prolyl cis-trans isomerase (rotamase) - cyclophilin family
MLRLRPTLLLIPLFALAACSPDTPSGDNAGAIAAAEQNQPLEHTLVPLPGKESEVPVLTVKQTVLMQTDAGDLTIEVYPQAAPNAAQRFIELVENGFYNDTPISRVVPGFVAQFGVNWRDGYNSWQFNTFNDDPTLFSLERGTLAFAKAGPNSNSTQVFINYVENNRLAEPQYNFTVFGKVVEGMDVVDQFVQVGDPGMGLDQGRLWSDGANYLESLDTKPTMIRSARVID